MLHEGWIKNDPADSVQKFNNVDDHLCSTYRHPQA